MLISNFNLEHLGETFTVWSNESDSGTFDMWKITRVKTGKNIGGTILITLDRSRQGPYIIAFRDLMDQAKERIEKHLKAV